MNFWVVVFTVAIAGGIGGGITSLLSGDKGFAMPTRVHDGPTSPIIWRPGWIGGILIGMVAGLATWGLPLSSQQAFAPITNLSIGTLATVIIAGIGGSRVLSDAADKSLLRASASVLATQPADNQKAAGVATASAMDVFKIALSPAKVVTDTGENVNTATNSATLNSIGNSVTNS